MPFFSISGIQIEFVNQWPQLGHLITDSLDDNNDIAVRRNTLCGQINNVICYFANLNAVTKLKLINTYCSSFMAVSFGILKVLRFRMCALLGVWDLGAFGGCLLIRTVTCYL